MIDTLDSTNTDRLYGSRTPPNRHKNESGQNSGRQECGARAGAILNSLRPARAAPGRAQKDTRRDRAAGRDATNAAPRATPQPKPPRSRTDTAAEDQPISRRAGADVTQGARAGQNNS